MKHPIPTIDPRRLHLLDAAVRTFLRYGFRKTSMEEVAQAARLSRQALYLHYPTKEALFRAAVQHLVDQGLAEAEGRLADETQPLEARLVGALDAWVGRYVGMVGADVGDLVEAAGLLVAPLLRDADARLLEAMTRAIRATALPAAYRAADVSARQLAQTLCAVARGLKHEARSREDFVAQLAVAARALCLPLRARRSTRRAR